MPSSGWESHVKKDEAITKEQDAVKAASCLSQIATIPMQKIAYVDETDIDR